jgi:hypothetical protein
MARKKRRQVRRRWLNLPNHHSTGFIRTTAETSRWQDRKTGKKDARVDCGVSIGDCGRQIHLDFDFEIGQKGERDNAYRKIAILIQMLSDLENEMMEREDEMLRYVQSKD